MTVCPHCGSSSREERDSALRWRCGVCGGPVVPAAGSSAPSTRSYAELGELVAAQRSRAMALGWTVGAIVLGACAILALGLAGLLWFASHAAALVVGVVGAGAALLAVAGLHRARRRNGDAGARLEQAWEIVAGEVLRSRGGVVTSDELATTLQTDVAHAERLLARLSASGRVRVEVQEDAELVYRTEEDTTDTRSDVPEAGSRNDSLGERR